MERGWNSEQLDGGSGLWKKSADERFWLEGSSDEEESEIGWTPAQRDLKAKEGEYSSGEDDSSNDGDDKGEGDELSFDPPRPRPQTQPQSRANEKPAKWERKYKEKFDALFAAIPRRNPAQPAKVAHFTDAILSCPGCFSIVCEMCQRHESDFNRYRAMEVTKSCKVDRTSLRQETTSFYFPVLCAECNAEIGALDEENFFHLYNVIPSNPS